MAAVTEARRLIKGARGRRVCFKHIPWEQNCLADWLCHMALKMRRHVPEVASIFPDLGEGDVPPVVLDLQEVEQQPAMPVPRGAEAQLEVLDGDPGGPATDSTCTACSGQITGEQVSHGCWGCGARFHGRCTNPPAVARGPWHCSKCLRVFRRKGLRDLTLDRGLMAHLAGAESPDGVEFARCMRAAQSLRLDDSGQLWTRGRE